MIFKEFMLAAHKKNLISIDIARAFAALGVFYYHQHCGSILARYTGINLFGYTEGFGAFYAVPLFFLISGYCIHLSNLKYLKEQKALPIKQYYKRRFLRIYPPYLAAVIFSLLVNHLTLPNYPNSWSDLLIHVFLLQGLDAQYFNSINVVLWTITIEMAFYIIYPFFYYLRLKLSLDRAILSVLIISAVSIIYFSRKNDVMITQFYCVFNLWFAWCCGAYIADKKAFCAKDLNKTIYKIIYAAILLVFIWLQFYPPANFGIVKYQVNILIWTAPLLFLLNKEHWLEKRKSYFLKIFSAVGLSSYSLYLLHEPLIALKNYLVHEYLPHNLLLAGVFIGIFVIPFITWLSYLYIEKPFISKKRKLIVSE
jgi:peptidoglycan/LPS O-acetylase OafA/YrhL